MPGVEKEKIDTPLVPAKVAETMQTANSHFGVYVTRHRVLRGYVAIVRIPYTTLVVGVPVA